jgi:hypothetical protein
LEFKRGNIEIKIKRERKTKKVDNAKPDGHSEHSPPHHEDDTEMIQTP